ncbi:MAG: fumarylacetoacetate hydrolase family protein [Planctomycetota bacterium]|nr:fumarylacetoacetate hydrolase family protein [Planctomycetota bacterium]
MSTLPIRNIYCIGRNYAAHARELGNDPSAKPLIFMKPLSAVISDGGTIVIPHDSGSCHHEIELALQLGEDARFVHVDDAPACISAYAVALDMTLRDLQNDLKKKGWPWDIAKAFESSLPLGSFVPASEISKPSELDLNLKLNGRVVQEGCTNQMILSPYHCVSYVSQYFQLRAGDVIITGTPAGVGPVHPGDKLEASISGLGTLTVGVAAEAAPALDSRP